MTNISEDRRVVLTALREVPYETTFLLSEATQDQSIKHRYWFDFPAQWSNQANKDPIIGIRDIYLTKTNRFISYRFRIDLEGNDTQNNTTILYDSVYGYIEHWLDAKETITTLIDNFNKQWFQKAKRNPQVPWTDDEHEWKADEVKAYLKKSENGLSVCFAASEESQGTYNYLNENTDQEIECTYIVSILPISNDAKTFFGTTEDYSISGRKCLEVPITWTRHQCLVKSSIANNDKNNILGHTRNDPYVPIKYYRLNKDVKKFWIELYETRYHDCPVSLPLDKLDDLIIEAIVCLSSSGML